MEEAFLHLGGSIGYWGGDVRRLAEDIRACQPTIFCSVPRIYERFHNVVMEKVGWRGVVRLSLAWYSVYVCCFGGVGCASVGLGRWEH